MRFLVLRLLVDTAHMPCLSFPRSAQSALLEQSRVEDIPVVCKPDNVTQATSRLRAYLPGRADYDG